MGWASNDCKYMKGWRLKKKYDNFESFYKAYYLQINKWQRLLKPVSHNEIYRSFRINYMGSCVYKNINFNDDSYNIMSQKTKLFILKLFDRKKIKDEELARQNEGI